MLGEGVREEQIRTRDLIARASRSIEFRLFCALCLLSAAFSILYPATFPTAANLANMSRVAGVLFVVTAGQMCALLVGGFDLFGCGVEGGMVARSGAVSVDEVIAHQVDIVDQGCDVRPVDGTPEIVCKATGREADELSFAQLPAEQYYQCGEMVFVFGSIGVTGNVLQRGIFPVEVDAVGMEKVGEVFYTGYKFFAAAVGGEDVGACLTASPAAEREYDLEPRILFLQADEVPDDGAVACAIDRKLIAFEVAEAEDDMG